MIMRAVTLFLLLLVLAGCGTTPRGTAADGLQGGTAAPQPQTTHGPPQAEPEATATASTASPTYGDEGDWRDAEGLPPPPRAIVRLRGPEHCDWHLATLLEIDWRALGFDIPAPSGGYVDDLSSIPMDGRGTAEPGVDATGESRDLDTVPDHAIDTGLTEDGARLWAAPDGRLIWLQYDDRVEQWPVLLAGCM